MWSNSRYFWTRDSHRVREGAAVLISGCHGDEFHENVLLYQLVAWLLPAGLSFFFTDGSHLGSVMNLRRLNLRPYSNKADPEQLPVSASRHSWKYRFLQNAHKPQNLFKTQASVNPPPHARRCSTSLRYSHVITSRTEVTSDMKLDPIVLLDIRTECFDKTSDTTETTLILRDSAATRPSSELEKVSGQTCCVVL